MRNDAIREQAVSSGWFETGSFLILIAAIFVSIRVFAVGPASILILLLVFMRLMPRVIAAYAHYQGIVNQLPAFTAITELESECLAASEQIDSQGPPVEFSSAVELRHISFAYQMAAGAVIQRRQPRVESWPDRGFDRSFRLGQEHARRYRDRSAPARPRSRSNRWL